MWKTAITKTAGAYHIYSQLPCQDAVYSYGSDHCSVMVIADGAGSVESSEIISDAMADSFAQWIHDEFDQLYDADEEAVKEAVIKRIKKTETVLPEGMQADCTLLAAAVDENRRCLIIHVGDGIAIGTGENSRVLSYPENGDQPNLTFFLSIENIRDHIRITRESLTDINSILICSDGASDALYDRINHKISGAAMKMTDWLRKHSSQETKELIDIGIREQLQNRSADDISIGIMDLSDPEDAQIEE